jgi:hypothetical protein
MKKKENKPGNTSVIQLYDIGSAQSCLLQDECEDFFYTVLLYCTVYKVQFQAGPVQPHIAAAFRIIDRIIPVTKSDFREHKSC